MGRTIVKLKTENKVLVLLNRFKEGKGKKKAKQKEKNDSMADEVD